jgi:hypothetical protein
MQYTSHVRLYIKNNFQQAFSPLRKHLIPYSSGDTFSPPSGCCCLSCNGRYTIDYCKLTTVEKLNLLPAALSTSSSSSSWWWCHLFGDSKARAKRNETETRKTKHFPLCTVFKNLKRKKNGIHQWYNGLMCGRGSIRKRRIRSGRLIFI